MDATPRMLRAFLAVAEEAGFTAAARRLDMAQSAVSELVAALEQALGARLLARSTRRVSLTPAGEAFRPRAAAILADLDAAARAARQVAAGAALASSLATTPLLAAALAPTALRRFAQALPEGRVSLVEAPAAGIPDLVRAGSVALGLGTFPAPTLEGLVVERLFTDRLALFCPAGHPLAARRSVAWRELEGEAWIGLDASSALRGLIEGARLAAGLAPLPPVQAVSQIATVLALVEARLGVAVLPQAGALLLPRRKLAMRALTGPVVSRDVVLIRRPGPPDTASAALAVALRPVPARNPPGPRARQR
jgi:DNA-binding transcriptional LysR family regulator